jgi:hypothetical protein
LSALHAFLQIEEGGRGAADALLKSCLIIPDKILTMRPRKNRLMRNQNQSFQKKTNHVSRGKSLPDNSMPKQRRLIA